MVAIDPDTATMIPLPRALFVLGYIGSMCVVIAISLVPPPQVSAPEGSDKALHLIAYAMISLCGGLGFRYWNARFLAATTALGVGVLLEFLQDAWFDRNGSVLDAVANAAGCGLGLIAAALALRWVFVRLPDDRVADRR